MKVVCMVHHPCQSKFPVSHHTCHSLGVSVSVSGVWLWLTERQWLVFRISTHLNVILCFFKPCQRGTEWPEGQVDQQSAPVFQCVSNHGWLVLSIMACPCWSWSYGDLTDCSVNYQLLFLPPAHITCMPLGLTIMPQFCPKMHFTRTSVHNKTEKLFFGVKMPSTHSECKPTRENHRKGIKPKQLFIVSI